MDFFTQAVSVIQTILILIGAGLGIWGVVNLLEGYGNDNRATRPCHERTDSPMDGMTGQRPETSTLILRLAMLRAAAGSSKAR